MSDRLFRARQYEASSLEGDYHRLVDAEVVVFCGETHLHRKVVSASCPVAVW